MQVVLKVLHNGEQKMVGKVLPTAQGDVFLHEEVSGAAQHHANLDSPGGIDAVVLEWLARSGVTTVHHYRRESSDLFIAPVRDILDFGVRQRSGGRDRVYLPVEWWAQYHGPLPYSVKWITDSKTLDPTRMGAV